MQVFGVELLNSNSFFDKDMSSIDRAPNDTIFLHLSFNGPSTRNIKHCKYIEGMMFYSFSSTSKVQILLL